MIEKLKAKLRQEGREVGDARAWAQWRIVGLSALLAMTLVAFAQLDRPQPAPPQHTPAMFQHIYRNVT